VEERRFSAASSEENHTGFSPCGVSPGAPFLAPFGEKLGFHRRDARTI